MKKSVSKYSDMELLTLLRTDKKQSEAAFTVIYDRYSSQVFAYCKCAIMETEQAKDIYQETFLKFYQKVMEGVSYTNVLGYLLKIARNLCLNYKRDLKHNLSIEDLDLYIDDEIKYDDKELFELLLRSMDLLDEKYREAFFMSKIQGICYDEIASILEISVPAVRSRVKRARLKVMEVLEPYMKELCK